MARLLELPAGIAHLTGGKPIAVLVSAVSCGRIPATRWVDHGVGRGVAARGLVSVPPRVTMVGGRSQLRVDLGGPSPCFWTCI